MQNFNWYETIIRPSWAPPSFLFGPVWTILYAFIFTSFSFVFYRFYEGKISFVVVLPFILNLIFNFAFTPLQFQLKNNFLAFIDILLVLGTLVWAMFAIWPYFKWITIVNMPYLLWVSFATILQASITYLNWK